MNFHNTTQFVIVDDLSWLPRFYNLKLFSGTFLLPNCFETVLTISKLEASLTLGQFSHSVLIL